LSLLFKYNLTTNLSVRLRIADVAKPLVLTSTGVVLFVSHPNGAISDVNNNVSVPPVVLSVTVK
jgi:hypothetical protein